MAKAIIKREEISEALFAYFTEKYGIIADSLRYHYYGGSLDFVQFEYELLPKK